MLCRGKIEALSNIKSHFMKYFYLSILSLFLSTTVLGQIVWESNFDTWTSVNEPENWLGDRTSLETDSVMQITTGATFGDNLAQLTNLENGHKRFTTEGIALDADETYEVEVWLKGTAEVRTNVWDSEYGTYNSYVDVDSDEVISFVQTISPDTTFEACEVIISLRNGIVELDRVEIRIGEEVVLTPIALTIPEVQMTTSGDSPYVDSLVSTSGVVTAVAENGYFIQDGEGAWTGIRVFDPSNTVAIGDEVSVTGIVGEFFDQTQVGALQAFEITGQAAVPAATVLGTGEVADEMYESVLVTTLGTCDALLDFGEWTLNDGTDPARVDDEFYDVEPVIGTTYEVTGPLQYNYGDFKITPRDMNDVSIISGLVEESTLEVSVYPNPAADFLTIARAEATPLMLSIFDITGAVVQEMIIQDSMEQVDVTALATGMYTVVLRADDAASAIRIAVK